MAFDPNPANTPLLLIAWRRPHILRQVIDAIRPVAPTRLFVACDGPNPERPGEAEKVAATRAVIEHEIDWPCQVERLYSDENQGCRIGPIRAISWFFEQVDEGIILEDDCVPHPDFFPYCTTLLQRYRHDTRVWCISGNNFQNGQWRGDGSYYFSRYNHCWGWASWRRCWQHYDGNLSHWPAMRDSGLLGTIFEDPLERNYWSAIWQRTHSKAVDITWWDYQWTFTCLTNSGLTALPNRNLVSNVGFGVDATHTTGAAAITVANQGLGELTHPSFVVRDEAADKLTSKQFYIAKPKHFKLPWHLTNLLIRVVKACTSKLTTLPKKSRPPWLGPEGIIENPKSTESISVGPNTFCRGRLFCYSHAGKISIGEWCYIGVRSEIWSMNSIIIGNRVLISHDVNIHDGTGHSLDPIERHNHFKAILERGHPNDINDLPGLRSAPIVIEDDVWISFGVTILKGVSIGRGSVIAAGSTVIDNVPPYSLYRNTAIPIVIPLRIHQDSIQ